MTKLLRLTLTALVALPMPAAVSYGQHYTQTNLVSSAGKTPDSDLIDPWGISRSGGSPWWVADAGTGLSTLYAGDGTKEGLVVTIPAVAKGKTGTPTGTIYNGSSTSFLLGKGAPAVFLFCTLDGAIEGWNPAFGVAAGKTSTKAVIAAKGKKGSVYTGMTSALVDGVSYLYAANVSRGTVDVFDSTFKPYTFPAGEFEAEPFTDDLLPVNYSPYNVQAIGQNIVVTYAYVPPGSGFPMAGSGLGYVDVYWPDGQLKQHLEHGEWLNGPWGVALAPTDFGRFSHSLLIGNFAGGEGDAADFSGTIAAYDLVSGKFLGNLENANGKTLAIQGLWALSPGNSSPGNLDTDAIPGTTPVSNYGPAEIYFTAGPSGGSKGLFGFLTAAASDQIEGNDQ
jgi:uncharacterized protein (TIGR03118 family)